MKAKEQKKERSKTAIQELGEKDLCIAKAGTISSTAVACDCVCVASACAC